MSFELNNIYFSLDAEIKNREAIGSSLIRLQDKMSKIQKKMYNVSRFLTDTASRYRTAERAVETNGARIRLLTTVSANRNGTTKNKDEFNGWFVPVGTLAGEVGKQTKTGSYVYRTPEIKATKKQGVISYLKSSARQLFLGNYTDDVTVLGTAAQVGTGIIGVDLPMDLRDLSADFKNWKWTGDHVGQTVLDTVGLIPVIGVLKNADEVGTLIKGAKKADDANVFKVIKDVEKGKNVDIIKGSSNPKLYNPVEFKGTVKVNGELRDVSRRVHQRGDIEPNYFDDNTGLTNLERMKKGKPPIGSDGNPIQLHHLTQQERGSMVEILEHTHQEYFSQLHGLVGKGESLRNNLLLEKQYNNFRAKYWKNRYGQFIK